MRSAAGCWVLGHMQLGRPPQLHEYQSGGSPAGWWMTLSGRPARWFQLQRRRRQAAPAAATRDLPCTAPSRLHAAISAIIAARILARRAAACEQAEVVAPAAPRYGAIGSLFPPAEAQLAVEMA